jgi:hypothetical protein
MKTRILTFTLSTFLCVAARAELKWEQNIIELHPAVGDKQAIAHFKYENIGTTPVHFKSVHPSCGCTTTQTQKDVVAPKEKGEIIATFNIGDRTGQQVKTVTVQTDDPDPAHATTILTLKADINPSLEIKPTFVYWRGGEEPKPKKITVKAAKQFPVKNITIKSNSQIFSSKVEPGSVPGEWTIEVQPKETTHPVGTALLIQTDYPKEAPRSFYVNAAVTAAPGAVPAKVPMTVAPGKTVPQKVEAAAATPTPSPATGLPQQ